MDSQRRSIEVPGLHHGANPIPVASRIGPFLVSGGISGMDPKNGEIPEGIEVQCRLMFENIRRIMETAEGSTENIIKMTVWLKDKEHRGQLNKEWMTMFPDSQSRPVRHVLIYNGLPGTVLIQCEFMAILGNQ